MAGSGNLQPAVGGSGATLVALVDESSGVSAEIASNGAVYVTDKGTSTPVLKAALSTTVFAVSAAPCTLNSYYIYNPNSSVAYVQLFDVAAGSVSLGTTTPKWAIGIPASSGANLSRLKMAFTTALSVAATTTATGSSAPATALDTNWGIE